MNEPGAKQSFFHSLAEKLHLARPKYEIFLCVGPDCCASEAGARSLDHLKKRLHEVGMDKGEVHVRAVKTGCLKICGNGPIGVVYPGEIWYEKLVPERIDKVVEEHFAHDRPVSDFVFSPPIEARPPRRR